MSEYQETEPADETTNAGYDDSITSRPHSRGLDWGQFQFVFDYDYVPEDRHLNLTAGGQRVQKRIMDDARTISSFYEAALSLKPTYLKISRSTESLEEPYWDQPWLPAGDAISIYTLIVSRKPDLYLEVGSGNSTKFARRAIRDFGLKTKIVSIDPNPRSEIDGICDRVIRKPMEKVNVTEIAAMVSPGDVVFVDGSHRSFQGSDVTICFTELLPALPHGVAFGVHDINVPYDYEPSFRDFFYNEQYLLFMYLLAGAHNDLIISPVYFARHHERFSAILKDIMESPSIPTANRGGSSFWFIKNDRSKRLKRLFTPWRGLI